MDLELQELIIQRSCEDDNGCWISKLKAGPNGYCQMQYKTKKQDAHRFSYTAFIGEIPFKMKVCHSCDVRCCVNPDHLFLGTDQENMEDAAVKGRTARKFSNDDVWTMRRLRRKGTAYKEIAKQFNTTYFAVYAICKRWRRKHI